MKVKFFRYSTDEVRFFYELGPQFINWSNTHLKSKVHILILIEDIDFFNRSIPLKFINPEDGSEVL